MLCGWFEPNHPCKYQFISPMIFKTLSVNYWTLTKTNGKKTDIVIIKTTSFYIIFSHSHDLHEYIMQPCIGPSNATQVKSLGFCEHSVAIFYLNAI